MTSTSISRLTGLSSGVAFKAPCRAATTANITLSGTQTIDGVAVVADDRVLVKDQTDQTTNGIYEVDTAGWSRAKDFDGARDIKQGTLVLVNAGNISSGLIFKVTTANPVTVGSSDIEFEALPISDIDASEVVTKTGTQTLTNKTITNPIISQISNVGTVTIPAVTDTLVGKATTDTLTNKTFDTAGAGNALLINGVAASANTGTGAVVRASSPTLITPTFSGLATGTTPSDGVNSTAVATTAFHWSNIPTCFRNGLINGDMAIAQRGTSFTSISTTITQVLDGWNARTNTAGTMTISQQTGSGPDGFNSVLRVQRPNGNSQTCDHDIAQIIETRDCYRYQGRSCTLSFYAKKGADMSSNGSVISVLVETGTGSDQGATSLWAFTWTDAAFPLNSSSTLTSSWARYSHSVSIPATATEVAILFLFTPTGTAGAADYYDITGVQLEAGPLTPYEHLPAEVSLNRCRRFYQKTFPLTTAPAQSAGVTSALSTKNPIANGAPSVYWPFNPPMRTTPAITTYNPSASNANWRNITAAGDSTVSVDPGSAVGQNGVLIATSSTVTSISDILAIHASAEAAL